MESEHAATSELETARPEAEPLGDAARPTLPLRSLEHADPRLRRATVLALQRACGNAAVARLVQRGPLGTQPGAARVLARTPGTELGTTWFEIDQQRRAEREAAETGAGRQTTLDRLATMTDQEARRETPGIAFRAQDRGDVELARAATDRLLAAWLASTDHPGTLTAGFGPDDAVDVLLDRAETAFDGDEPELGGALLSVALVQLVRAARTAVLRRPTTDVPELRGFFEVLGELQRHDELEVRRRVERARALLERRGRAAAAAGDAAARRFEAIAEAVHAAERRAGPAIAGDLGAGRPGRRRRGAEPRFHAGRARVALQPTRGDARARRRRARHRVADDTRRARARGDRRQRPSRPRRRARAVRHGADAVREHPVVALRRRGNAGRGTPARARAVRAPQLRDRPAAQRPRRRRRA
jgi:hypothetical protein